MNSAWEDDINSEHEFAPAVPPNENRKPVQPEVQKPVIQQHLPTDDQKAHEEPKANLPELKESTNLDNDFATPNSPASAQKAVPAVQVAVPDRTPGKVNDVYLDDATEILHPAKPPGKFEPSTTFSPPIHWTQVPEHFPVEEGSLISLPTGSPASIPTIQHKFGQESAEAKATREKRLAEIKTEMKRAWDGYTWFAFGHDELVPLSQTFRDPFGGWGATLVDSMDSLWIMDLKEEFDAAYEGLKYIDFTTTPRNDIPVFETTIRYLGGLLAAYDVTGGHKGQYPLLLVKAVELAEILMGVFDTPNRMPILYYNWKPAYASQPHRASTRAGVAEMGTLSMEFTRLAQLTGKDKYYDAIARITDALEEWQNREDETAAMLPGIFPEIIDASGCNKSATAERAREHELAKEQAEPVVSNEPQGYIPKATALEMEVRDKKHGRRDIELRGVLDEPLEMSTRETGDSSRGSARRAPPPHMPFAATGLPEEWECVPQNLTASSGTQNFGMGGSQDSAYEYFPKQFLLLGGLEAKYQTMHEKTVAAVKKYLLFRPMTTDDSDILFSAKAKVSTSDTDLSAIKHEYEVTHLTCFLGGMFAMGAKIFGSEEDLEIGRRLTDGCVWAYASMPSGIMAEYAQVTPCLDVDDCHWNETAWHLGIDPNPEQRVKQMEGYLDRLAQWELDKAEVIRAEAERQQMEVELAERTRRAGGPAAPGKPVGYSGSSSTPGTSYRIDDDAQYHASRSKRSVNVEEPEDTTPALDPSTLDQKAIAEKIKQLEAEFGDSYNVETTPAPPPDGSFGGMAGQVPIEGATPKMNVSPNFRIPPRPHRPDTHEEYVANHIVSEALPPSYTKIGSNAYQLRYIHLHFGPCTALTDTELLNRPEAIESVWYMYRITGDSTWQEKGWEMWKAIISNVRAETAHSAISGVNFIEGTGKSDKMESFWTAETLKYFYLLYSEPDVVSLDDWVLNTEAHPFRRPS